MCVALPGQIVWIGEATDVSIPARMRVDGREIDVDLATVAGVEVGDFIIAHSGYAVRQVPAPAAPQPAGDLATRPQT